MRTLFIPAAVVALVLAGFALVSAPRVEADAAIVIKAGGGCTFFDGTGAFVAGDRFHGVITDSANGNRLAVCEGIVAPSPSGKAVQFDFESTGVLCSAEGVVTTKWHETVSASGKARIVCHVPDA